MIYCGYGIITDFSALSSTMWWWSLSKITWFCVGYIALWGLTLIMGFFTCSTMEDYSQKLIEKIKIERTLEPLKTGSSKNIRLGIISQNAHRW